MMRVALVSYEYPPSLAVGGIGTYTYECARMLALSGVNVEVFAAGRPGFEVYESKNLRINRVTCSSREDFNEAIVPVFGQRHEEEPFDLMESPELGADGFYIAFKYPEVARVVRLHTPSFMCSQFGSREYSFTERLRFRIGAARRGKWQGIPQSVYKRQDDKEFLLTQSADAVTAPSRSIVSQLADIWHLDRKDVFVYPNPFCPSSDLLGLARIETVKTIGFLGRLETRKGILEFARAFPTILSACKDLTIRMIGPSWPYRDTDMQSWILKNYSRYQDRLHFTGAVNPDDIRNQLSYCHLFVLPSRWENFPYACWEVMAAARVVVGSSSGGMAEVIQHGQSGMLIPPRSPKSIADAILKLYHDPTKAQSLAALGRQRILDILSPEAILPKLLESYNASIKASHQRGPCS